MAARGTELQFEPLHPTFGAECIGVDFSAPVSDDVISAISAGMAKYGVLVFRQTALDDAGHVAFAGRFGDLDDTTTWLKPGQKYRLAPHVQLTDVGNIEEDGLPVSTESMRHQINLGNGLFHVDCSYNPRRAGFSMLRAHQLPPKGTGGGTEFADTRTAYDDLDDATKARIQDLVLCHSLWYSRQLGAPDNEILKQIDPTAQAMARHKLVQLHEPSGRQNLYIAWHAHHIDSWSKDASRPVIEELLRHASQDKYTFRVDWENNGDLVIWDNTCVMHRACGGTFAGRYVRDMRRATVHDSSPTAWGLNEAKESRSGLFANDMKEKSWYKPQTAESG